MSGSKALAGMNTRKQCPMCWTSQCKMHPLQDSGAAQRKKMESVKNTQALMKKKYNDIMAKQLEKIAADEYGQVGTSEGTAYQQVRERAGEGAKGRAIAERCGKVG